MITSAKRAIVVFMIPISYSSYDPANSVPSSVSNNNPVDFSSNLASSDLTVHPAITMARPAPAMFFCSAADIYPATVSSFPATIYIWAPVGLIRRLT